MKKLFLLSLVVMPILAVVGFGSLLFAANRVGEDSQRTFFAAVATGKTENVMNLLDPRLHEQIDAPVLKQWMKAVNKNLGQYRGIDWSDFDTQVSKEADANTTESEATVLFEKGKARSEVVFVNGKIVRFNVESVRLQRDWFQGPKETDLYCSRALAFYRAIAAGKPAAARTLMSDELREEISEEAFEKMVAKVNSFTGELQRIEVLGDKYTDTEEKGQRLEVSLRFIGQQGTLDATAAFRFIGLRGVLTGFNMDKAN